VVNRTNLLRLGLLTFLASLCSAESREFITLDRDPDLACQLVKHENALLLDVRTWWEFKLYRLPGAKNIWVGDLSKRLEEVSQVLGGKKDRPIVVYCTKGVRAGEAKKILQEGGFTNVTNLGGIADWTDCD
jgi:rhodanese-related sulfurtransferase